MELKMNEYQLPENILFNYEELKQELTEKAAMYETLVYTDEQIKEAKSDKANLNKLKKALNDERIRREKEYLQPFNDFKAKINEIIGIIDKPVQVIDTQVKEYEDKQKQDKMEQIKNFWNSCTPPFAISLEEIFDSKWLNASVSMKSIQNTIGQRIEQVEKDLATLRILPEFSFEAEQVYISTLDITKAINEAHRMSEMQKAKAAHEAEMTKLREEEEKARIVEPEPVQHIQAEPVQEKAPEKQWVSFSALLTTEDAIALKQFFQLRSIEFKAV